MTPEPAQELPGPGELTVIAVRHGRTDLTGHVLNGCGDSAADPELNSEGRQQVTNLRRLLTGWGWLEQVQRTVASPARRAIATAQELTGSAVDIDVRLCEVDFGRWEGRSLLQLWNAEPELVSHWHSDPAFAPPDGTSLDDVAQRLYAWRAQWQSEVPQGGRAVVLVVAHASTVRILIAAALGLALHQASRLEVGTGAAAIMRFWADGGSSLEALIPTQA